MGNSPSVGLGGGSAHSLGDVRIANPEKEVDRPRASHAPTHNEYTELLASQNPHNGAQRGAQKFKIRRKCRIRRPARIPTPFLYQSTKKSKCQPARVLPASREEPGSPRTRCSTDPARHRTPQKFDWQFDRQHQQQHQKQFDREQRRKKFDVDPEDQQNFILKFDADQTEKLDKPNVNKTE